MNQNTGFFLRLFLLSVGFGLMVVFVPQFTGSTFADALEAQTYCASDLDKYLKSFYADTAATMRVTPAKWDASNHRVVSRDTPFSSMSDKLKYYRSQKMASSVDRFELEGMVPSPPRTNDLVENLVQVPHIMRHLQEMEDANLTSQDLANKPWSDSYWPDDHGMIAARYADPSYPNSSDWQANLAYTQEFSASALVAQNNTKDLAPSEKYDSLMGDSSFTLTKAAWSTIQSLGAVASWEGICDGWSAASVSLGEPTHAVTLTGATGGTPIRFFPSDVKALSTLLWAKGSYAKNFVGAICDQVNPPRDSNGRVIAPECQGNNPGTWHMAVVNQLGQAQRALIIDASNDNQIWNFPMWHYKYSYFNPQTLQTLNHWSDAIIAYDQFTIDKFKSYRSPQVKYVVGISMEISYMIEVTPTHNDGAVAMSRTVHYVYDLELDANDQIIGGEWYTSIHPDFLWTPRLGAAAVSIEDSMISDPNVWTGSSPMPSGWAQSAQRASQYLQPLAAVVQQLVKFSH